MSLLSGSGLLSQYGDHAPGREAPQRDDRPPDEKGTFNNLINTYKVHESGVTP